MFKKKSLQKKNIPHWNESLNEILEKKRSESSEKKRSESSEK